MITTVQFSHLAEGGIWVDNRGEGGGGGGGGGGAQTKMAAKKYLP